MLDRTVWLLAGITTLAAVLRFATLGVQDYWYDEFIVVVLVRRDLLDLVEGVVRIEATPPLYYVLAWVWSKLLGTGEYGLRSLSALAGTATVPVAYLAAKELISRRAGLLAAALVAVNPLLIWYSQEARSYALFVLLGTLSFLLFARVLDHPSRRRAAWWATFSCLAVATHYFAVFVVIPEALWLLYRVRPRGTVAASVGVVGGVLAVLLPLAVYQARPGHVSWLPEIALGQRLVQIPSQYLVGPGGPAVGLAAAIAVPAVIAALWLLLNRGDSRERRGARIAAGCAAAAIGIPLASTLSVVGPDYLLARNVTLGVPLLAIVLAAGLGARRAGATGLVCAGALCSLWLAVSVAAFGEEEAQRPAWEDGVRGLEPPPGQRAIVAPGEFLAYPLTLYRPNARRMSRGSASVSEIVVLSFDKGSGREECWWGGSCQIPSPGTRPPTPPRRFSLGERHRDGPFTITRFRAREPVSTSRATLRSLAPEADPAVLLEGVREPVEPPDIEPEAARR